MVIFHSYVSLPEGIESKLHPADNPSTSRKGAAQKNDFRRHIHKVA